MVGRGQSASQRLLTRKFLLTYREKRGKENVEKGGKLERKRRKNCKREGRKLKMEGGKSSIMRRGPFFSFLFFFFFFFCFCFFFVFVFVFFCFLLFKTTKICFGATKMELFYRKKHFTPGKKSGKMTFPPHKKCSCYAPFPELSQAPISIVVTLVNHC